MADISIVVSNTGAGVAGNTQRGQDYLLEHPYMIIDPDRVEEVAATIRAAGLTVEVSRP